MDYQGFLKVLPSLLANSSTPIDDHAQIYRRSAYPLLLNTAEAACWPGGQGKAGRKYCILRLQNTCFDTWRRFGRWGCSVPLLSLTSCMVSQVLIGPVAPLRGSQSVHPRGCVYWPVNLRCRQGGLGYLASWLYNSLRMILFAFDVTTKEL